MSSENPYRPPQEAIDEQPVTMERSAPVLAVDSRFLIVTNGAVLPKRCVFTNSGDDLKQRWRPFQFSSFEMTYWQRNTVAQSRVWLLVLVLMLVLIAVGFVCQALIAIVFLVGLAMVTGKQLRAVGYKDGQFRIKGCCSEFLTELERELANGDESIRDAE